MNRLLLVASTVAFGFCAESLPSFEVASIKAVDRTGQPGHGSIAVSGPRVTLTGYTLSALILYAYDMRNYQITGGPGWIGSDTYTIAAKVEGDTPVETAEIRKMLQGLLAERFGVQLHRETKEVRVYLLEPGKTGAKLTPSTVRRSTMQMGAGRLTVAKFTTAQIAALLSSVVSRPVLDQTGMTGEFDVTLDSPDIMGRMQPQEDLPGPSIFTAIQEQLGLKMEPSKGPIEILVIDRAVKPVEN